MPACLHGAVELRGMEKIDALQRQARPAIVALSHIGPTDAIQTAIAEAGVSVLFMGWGVPAKAPANLKIIQVANAGIESTLAIKSAADHLRRGGIVVMAIDGIGTACVPRKFLGRALPCPRGLETLVRLTKAPVFTALDRWQTGPRPIAVEIYDPVPASVTAEGLTDCLLEWFDDEIRKVPGLMRLGRVPVLLSLPPWPEGSEAAGAAKSGRSGKSALKNEGILRADSPPGFALI